jgi:hypothetical protein
MDRIDPDDSAWATRAELLAAGVAVAAVAVLLLWPVLARFLWR